MTATSDNESSEERHESSTVDEPNDEVALVGAGAFGVATLIGHIGQGDPEKPARAWSAT